MNKKYTILYERLSRDDDLAGESNSIINQKQMLERYAEQNGFTPYIHLSDDGFSGGNDDRPGWQELIARIQADEVSAVVLKDHTRMARNYLQAGLCREMFRERGVRLIFVNDNVDTFLADDDFLPFREIMAEWYIRDCSRKVRSAYKTKGLSGKHVGNHALYGYKKSDADKNQWVIDEPAAAIVRRIFDMTVEGFGSYTIASKLSAEKVECPSYYLAERGWGHYKNRECSDPYRWWGTTVSYILSRLEYIGHTVNFKTTSASYKSKRREPNERENWAVFENTHEPIIAPETWETANRLRTAAKRHTSDLGAPRPLTGLLYCSDCGAKLYHERSAPDCDKPKNSYLCANYRKLTGDCTAHRINAAAVATLILETLRMVSQYAKTDETTFRARVTEMFSAKAEGDMKAQKKRLAVCEKRVVELDKLIKKLFEEHALGSLADKRFDLLSAEYEGEQADLEREIAALREGIGAYVDGAERADNFIALTRRYRDFTELTPSMIGEFVEKIVVHERADKWRKYTEQQVDIYLNFIGDFAVPAAPVEVDADTLAAEEAKRKRRDYHREYARKRKANGGKPITPPDTRTDEECAADAIAKAEKRKADMREYYRNNKDKWAVSGAKRNEKKRAERAAKKSAAEAADAKPTPAA